MRRRVAVRATAAYLAGMEPLPREAPRRARARHRARHVALAFVALAALVVVLDRVGTATPPPRASALRFAERELRRELVRNRLQLAEPRPGTLELRLPAPALVGRDVAGSGGRVDSAAVEGIARRVLEVYAPERARTSAGVDSVVVVLQGDSGWMGLVGGSPPSVFAFDAASLRPPALESAAVGGPPSPASRP
jgi:hypothetical protein